MLEYDFIIALPTNGINLRYDGSLQRLKSVECYDPNKVKLVYQNSDVRYTKFSYFRFCMNINNVSIALVGRYQHFY